MVATQTFVEERNEFREQSHSPEASAEKVGLVLSLENMSWHGHRSNRSREEAHGGVVCVRSNSLQMYRTAEVLLRALTVPHQTHGAKPQPKGRPGKTGGERSVRLSEKKK